MNIISRLLEPYDGLLFILLFYFVIGLIALNVYIVYEMKKRIQEKTDTYDIWFSVVCAILIEASICINIFWNLHGLLK